MWELRFNDLVVMKVRRIQPVGERYNTGNDQLETNTVVGMEAEKIEFNVTREDMLEADEWNLI
jgi:hypothetical protein